MKKQFLILGLIVSVVYSSSNESLEDLNAKLRTAADSGSISATIPDLLAQGAQVDSRDESGWTALHWAASNRNEREVKQLLAAGADATLKCDEGNTARDSLPWGFASPDDDLDSLLEEAMKLKSAGKTE